MQKNHTPIALITSEKSSKAQSIVIEVLALKDIKTSLLESSALQIAKKNLAKKEDDRDTFLKFHVDSKTLKHITFFFPRGSSLMDDRSSFFRNMLTKTLYIPSKDAVEAHEALTLASYRYQDYLSKKKESEYEILVTSPEKLEIEKRIPLYEGIIEARNLVNQPAGETYPKLLVDHMSNHKWKNFDLHVFDHKELAKL